MSRSKIITKAKTDNSVTTVAITAPIIPSLLIKNTFNTIFSIAPKKIANILNFSCFNGIIIKLIITPLKPTNILQKPNAERAVELERKLLPTTISMTYPDMKSK